MIRNLEWLKTMCGVDPERPHLHRLILVENGKRKMTMATNGVNFVAFDGIIGKPAPMPVNANAKSKVTPASVVAWESPSPLIAVDTAALRAWAGNHRPILVLPCPCRKCEFRHDVVIEPDVAQGLVGLDGFLLNRAILARILDGVDDDTITMHCPVDVRSGPLRLFGEGWQAAIMGMAWAIGDAPLPIFDTLAASIARRQAP